LIRSKIKEVISPENTPIIDTVERLQGQDVKCIIITFAASDESYVKGTHDFIFNPNRLNVMISRAKTKVIIIGSAIIQKELKEILQLV